MRAAGCWMVGFGVETGSRELLERMRKGATLEQAEQMMIRNALDRCSGNIQHTADMLGLSRAALYRRLEKYGMEA